MKKFFGVITGDIVQSGAVEDKRRYIKIIKNLFQEIRDTNGTIRDFLVFRGDSFQLLLSKPSDAALVSVILRAGLKTKYYKSSKNLIKKEKKKIKTMTLDMRLATGIGKADYIAKNLSESNGEAFLLSGLELDKMTETNDRIRIVTSDTELNKEILVLNKLVEPIINKWSFYSAEIAYMNILFNLNQSEMSKKLKISQPAVNQRISAANLDVIKLYLQRVSTLIERKFE